MHFSKLLNIYKYKHIHYKLLQNTNIPYKIPLLKFVNNKFNPILSKSKKINNEYKIDNKIDNKIALTESKLATNKNLKIIVASTITSIVSSITLYFYLIINNIELLFSL